MANNTSEIQKLYIAYFNRPADKAGLDFWNAQMTAGVTLNTVQNSFSSSAEYQAIYTGHTNAQLINLLYNNLFGHDADPAGLLWWLNEMTPAHTSPVQQTIQSIASVLSSGTTPGSPDNIAINDKIAAATAFTNAIDTTPELLGYDTVGSTPAAFASASAWLANVTDAATLATALADVDAALAAAIAANAAVTGQTFTLTTGVDTSGVLIGSLGTVSTAGNDTFVATVDSSTGGSTTLNLGDTLDGGAGTNTLSITVTHPVSNTLDIDGSAITNVQNLVVKSYELGSDALLNLNLSANTFTNVTLDYVNSYFGANTGSNTYVEGVNAQANFTVQNIRGSNDDDLYRNNSGASDDTAGTVSTSNTLKNINVSGSTYSSAFDQQTWDWFFNGNESFTNATTINHTLNVQNVNGVDSGSNHGYGIGIYDYVKSATAGSVINSTINISDVITNGSGDQNGEVSVYGSNSVGTSTYNVTANIANSDNISFYYEAGNGSNADTITYNLNNIKAGGTRNGAEIWSDGFETINVNVTGASQFNWFGDDGVATHDQTVNIVAGADFNIVKNGGSSSTYTEFDGTTGNVTINISGAGNVTLGETILTVSKGTVDAHALTGNLTMELVNDFAAVTGGSGNDSIKLDSALVVGHIADGRAGTNSMNFNNVGGTLIAQDYALINADIVNFQKLEFTNALTLDASLLTGTYSAFTFDEASTVTKVSGQTLTAAGDLTATSSGYDGTTTPHTYAGTLNVTETGNGSVLSLKADSANVTVKAGTADVGTTVSTSDLKTLLTINTVNAADSATAPTLDTLASASVTVVTGTSLGSLAAMTLTGNGSVTVDNSNGGTATKLATIDASALGGTLAYGTNTGNITGGLTYTANSGVTESIKLGLGTDVVTDNTSTYAKMDTITGFDAVQESATADKSTVDTLNFAGLTLDGSSANGLLEKITVDATVYTTLALAFTHAAATSHTDAKAVQFTYGGNTYLFNDTGSNGLLDNADLAVKLVGAVDLTTAFATHVA